MLPCVCSVIDHRRRQNVVRTSVTHSAVASCATFLFLPHFDVICDLLLNRRTATWNLFVNYNIASRATQSNSVYVSVLQISTVLADGVSKSLCQKFFSRERPLSARGKILYFATMMDTETRPTSPQTNTIFRPFLVG